MFGQVWPALLGVAVLPIYASRLGAEGLGLIAFGVSLQGLLTVLDVLSVGATRRIATAQAHQRMTTFATTTRTMEALYWPSALVVGIGLALGAGAVVDRWLTIDGLEHHVARDAVALIGITVALRFPEAAYFATLRGLERQRVIAVFVSMAATVRSLGGIASLVLSDGSVRVFFGWMLAAGLLEVLVLRQVTWHGTPGSLRLFDSRILVQLWRFSSRVAVISFFAVSLKQADRLAVGRLEAIDVLGFYGVALAIAQMLALVPTAIANVGFPRLTRLHSRHELDELAGTYLDLVRIAAMIVLPAAAVVAVTASDVLEVVVNRSAANAATTSLVSLAIAFGCNGVLQPSWSLELARGRTRLQLLVNVVAGVVSVPAAYLAVDRVGLEGATFPWLVFNIGCILFFVPIVHREAGIDHNQWGRAVLPGFAVAGCAALASMAAAAPFSESGPRLVASGLVGAAIVATAASAAFGDRGRRLGLRLGRIHEW